MPFSLLGLFVAAVVGGVALGMWHQQALPPANLSHSALPSSSPAAIAATSPPARTASKSAQPKQAAEYSPSPSPQPKSGSTSKPNIKPALTPEQAALNRKYKQAFESSQGSVDSLIEMRVAIAQAAPSLTVAVSAAASLLDKNGKPLHTLPAGKAYTAQPSGESIWLNSWQLPQLVWVEPPSDGVFYLGDRPYRGRLLLVSDSGRLWAVNFVNMRSYLYGVVPSEVSPSWRMEALKAQAVAARSYALTYHFKPVNSLYDMGDDEHYQVYSGAGREAESTSQAVDVTAGEFVSYRGGIVESLYAASDDIVAEAFQGRGMSQLGALNLAEKGYTYRQILTNYYPGTGVGRIQADYE